MKMMKAMADKKAVQNIEVRKELLKLQIRQQELEIGNDIRKLGESFTFPAIQNSFLDYLVKNPDTAFRAGLMAVNIISKLFQGKKDKAKK